MQDNKMKIYFFNSLSGKKEEFIPIDKSNIRIYVCGPTVYERPHIGNARSSVVYDLLFRFLRSQFPKISYVRNITDVDDKIIKASKEKKLSINSLTEEIIDYFHQDMAKINVLSPTIEPRATDNISEMINMIQKLIDRGFAYENQGNVLFNVKKYRDYGSLSKKVLDDLNFGARINVEDYKNHPLDFILWKPGADDDPEDSLFDSPWGRGRPGWHIECSAMSNKFLGSDFDIHGGGADLKFPHHENEIAQSVCSNENSSYAKYWLHNGFLTINGEKMSKSLGNFVNLHELMKQHHPMMIRYALMSSHYRKPLNFSDKLLQDASLSIDKFYNLLVHNIKQKQDFNGKNEFLEEIYRFMANDLNLSPVFNILHQIAKEISKSINMKDNSYKLLQCLDFLGLYDENLFLAKKQNNVEVSQAYIEQRIEQRKIAKKQRKWNIADEIRDELKNKGIILKDTKDGNTQWHKI